MIILADGIIDEARNYINFTAKIMGLTGLIFTHNEKRK